MIHHIYFDRDHEQGVFRTFDWLVEEVKEVGEALKIKKSKVFEEEFADVLVWLASLVNLVELDLEKAALSKYDNRCPKCKQPKCECYF